MRKIVYFLLAIGLTCTVNAQSFSDDFETYNVGDLIAQANSNWSTWSNNPGSAEDAPVSDAEAYMSNQSLYFSSTNAGGGPQDVVLPLGGHHTDGHMSISMQIFIENDKGAYFNFQGEETIGQDWSLNIFMLQTGEFFATDNNGTVGTANFNTGEWLSLEFDCDMTSNSWEILLNGNSLGTFSSASNQLASIDFFPYNAAGNGGNDVSGFYIDDISYEYTPYTPVPNDAALFTVDVSTLGLAGQEKQVAGSVINLGTEPLTSFDIEWTYGASSGSENVTSVNIGNLETYDFNFTTPITLIDGTNGLLIEITNVNAGIDDDPSNNDGTTNIQAVTPTPDKVVIAEEATGTWCGWCPRGAVFLEYMHETYDGYFAGIAVHDNDPMVVDEYDQGFGATSFPNLQVDRDGWTDPSSVELGFISRIQESIDGTIALNATYNAGQIDIDATVSAVNELDGYRLAVVLIENNVTGSGTGWAQANYYSGGGTVMGGYENLADPVPAADMVYHEVARAILGGANGSALGTIAVGANETQSFTYMVPADEQANQMKAIGILFEPNGEINNGAIADLATIVGLDENLADEVNLNLFPNPSNETSSLNINLEEQSNVTIKLTDLTGKTIYYRDYGMVVGNQFFPINTGALANGTYIVNIEIDGIIIPRKLNVRH